MVGVEVFCESQRYPLFLNRMGEVKEHIRERERAERERERERERDERERRERERERETRTFI